MDKRRGFSLIEIALVIGIIAIIAVVTLPNLSGKKKQTDLESVVNLISTTLREAQSRSISQTRGVGWGVEFDNGSDFNNPSRSYLLFASTTPQHQNENRRTLSDGIDYVPETLLPGFKTDVTFQQITGLPTKALTLGLRLAGDSNQMTVSVALSGQITFLPPAPVTITVAAAAGQIQSITQAAQQRSIDQADGHNWGIHFDNTNPSQPSYSLFHTAYSPSTVVATYTIPSNIEYAPTGQLSAGGSLNVIFDEGGQPQASYDISVRSVPEPAAVSTVSIRRNGEILLD